MRAKEQSKARRIREQKILKKRRSRYVERRFIGLGRRRAETDSILPFTDACVRTCVRAPCTRSYRTDDGSMITDVYVCTHTLVPEAPYQMRMLADKELRESSQEMTVSRQLRGKTWHIAFDSSEQWGTFLLLEKQIPITIRSQRLISLSASLSRSFPLKRNVRPRLLNVREMRRFSMRGSILQISFDTRREFGRSEVAMGGARLPRVR